MAECILETSGNASANIWKRGGTETAVGYKEGDDLVIPTGLSLNWNAAKPIRSIRFEGTSSITGTKILKVGASTGFGGYIVKIPATVANTFTAAIELDSTASERLLLEIGSEVFEISGATGKYKAGSSLKCSNTMSLSGTLDLNMAGFELSAKTRIEFAVKSIVNLEGSIIRMPSSKGIFSVGSEVTLLDSATTTYILEGLEQEFSSSRPLNGLVECNNSVQKITGTSIKKIAINNKGAAAGKGIKIATSTELKETVFTTNGTEANPARLESSESGVKAKLGIPEQEITGWIKIKDLEVPSGKGIWYLPHGTDEGGNATVGTTIKFEVKTEVFNGGFSQSLAVKTSVSGLKVGLGSFTNTAKAKHSLTATKIGFANPVQTVALIDVFSTNRISFGSFSQRLKAFQALEAQKAASGSLSQRVAFQGTFLANRSAEGVLVNETAFGSTIQSHKISLGELDQSLVVLPVLTGTHVSSAQFRQLVGIRSFFEGTTDELFIAPLNAGSISLLHTVSGHKVALGGLQNETAERGGLTGFKIGLGVPVQIVGIVGRLIGRIFDPSHLVVQKIAEDRLVDNPPFELQTGGEVLSTLKQFEGQLSQSPADQIDKLTFVLVSNPHSPPPPERPVLEHA